MHKLSGAVALGFVLCLVGCSQAQKSDSSKARSAVKAKQTKKEGCKCEPGKEGTRTDCTCKKGDSEKPKTAEPAPCK